jgi:hypothetical protein
MRLLLFDETIEGHHSMWMEQTALALGQMTAPSDVYYAFHRPWPFLQLTFTGRSRFGTACYEL